MSAFNKVVGPSRPMYPDGATTASFLQKRVEELLKEYSSEYPVPRPVLRRVNRYSHSKRSLPGTGNVSSIPKKILSNDRIQLHWYVGATGTGKTYKARTENPGACIGVNFNNWQLYNGQSCVIIDDVKLCKRSIAFLKAVSEPGWRVPYKSKVPLKIIFISYDSLPAPEDSLWWLSRYTTTQFPIE